MILPHSDTAESAILGSILVSPDLFAQARRDLAPVDFFRQINRDIFAAMERVHEAQTTIDPIVVANELEKLSDLDNKKAILRVSSLTDGVHKSANIKEYMAIVKEKAERRNIILRSNKLLNEASNGVDLPDLYSQISDLQRTSKTHERLWTPSTLEGVANPKAGEIDYVVEGLLPRGETTIMAATWKSGKTFVLYQLALDIITGREAFGSLKTVAATQPGLVARELSGK